jgi:hypothetical protein
MHPDMVEMAAHFDDNTQSFVTRLWIQPLETGKEGELKLVYASLNVMDAYRECREASTVARTGNPVGSFFTKPQGFWFHFLLLASAA